MRTAVVLLNYNGLHWLKTFLPAVLARSSGADVVVIDNGSTEAGTLDWLRAQGSALRLIALPENLGYAGGYQEGLQQLDGYELAVLMNTDIEPLEGWLEPLVARFAHQPRLGALQPKLRSHTHPHEFEYAGAMGGRMDDWGIPFAYGRTMGSYLLSPAPSVGASGAIFGLIGGLGVFFFLNRRALGEFGRAQVQSIVSIAVINLIIGFSAQGIIDNWGHLGGLLVGVLVGAALAPRLRLEPLLFPPIMVRSYPNWGWSAALGIALVLLALVVQLPGA